MTVWTHRSPLGTGLLVTHLLTAGLLIGSTPAEDFVTVRSKDGQRVNRRAGTIDDLTGDKLTLVSPNGQTESIPFDRVVEVSTEWTLPHRSGDALRKEGKLDQAVSEYRQAKRVESRPWALRQIQAQLVECLLARGDIEDAGDEFLSMMASDPQSPYFASIPLAWRNSAGDGGIQVRARAWMDQKTAPAMLLGASWLLGADRKAASAKLETLAKDVDPRIAKLAEAQLWRSNRATAKASDVRRWKATLTEMPDDLRPGPSLILGEVQLRQGEVDDALARFWEPAILHPQRLALSAEGLFLAARGAHQAQREPEAKRALAELSQHFAGTTFDGDAAQWARQVGLLEERAK